MGCVVMAIDRKTIKILLVSLDLEVAELAQHMGYDDGYVVNVLNGITDASPGFRRAFGETIGALILGGYERDVSESYPPAPLVAFIEKRAAEARSKREFYRELGTSAQSLRSRKSFDGIFVDRICCALGVHPSYVYGRDYDGQEPS
jgi:hypothetical protein